MRFTVLFKQVFTLVTSPANAWEELAIETGDNTKKDARFFYILFAINFFACFIGNLLNGDDFPVVVSSLRAIIFAIAIYGSYWGVLYILTDFLYKRFHVILDKAKTNRLIVFSFTLFLAINILTSLLPDILFFLKIAYIYTLFIVWEGVGKMIPSLDENERSNFVLLLSAAIIALPTIIEQVLLLAVPIAR